jgi:hypothetical protein
MPEAADRKDSVGSVAASPTSPPSPFSDALSEFVDAFGKKKKPSFVQDYLNGVVVSSHDVQTTLEGMEKKSSHKQIRKFLEPVVQAMVDYTGVLDTLCTFIWKPLSEMHLIVYRRSSGSDANCGDMGMPESIHWGMTYSQIFEAKDQTDEPPCGSAVEDM